MSVSFCSWGSPPDDVVPGDVPYIMVGDLAVYDVPKKSHDE